MEHILETTESFQLKTWSRNGIDRFHQNGEVTRDSNHDVDNEMELQIRITLEKVHLSNGTNGDPLLNMTTTCCKNCLPLNSSKLVAREF